MVALQITNVFKEVILGLPGSGRDHSARAIRLSKRAKQTWRLDTIAPLLLKRYIQMLKKKKTKQFLCKWLSPSQIHFASNS